MNELVALVKAAGDFAGPLSIVLVGVYSGQYAKLFKPPLDDYASYCCLGVLVIGMVGLVITLIKRSYQPQVANR